MSLETVYFREGQEYPREEMFRLLHVADTPLDRQAAGRFLRYLQDLGCLVRRRSGPPPDYEAARDGLPGGSYAFKYVGVMEFEDRFLIVCYPKYIHVRNGEAPPGESIRLVLRCLERHARSRPSGLGEAADAVEVMSRRLALNLLLVRDWLENGIYRKQGDHLEENGPGEIDWETTIGATAPVLQDGDPFYLECHTIAMEDIEDSYVSRLHRCIVSLAVDRLARSHVAEMLDVDLPVLPECDLSDYGGDAYVVDRLHQELGMQFGNRQQRLLKMLLAWIEDRGTEDDASRLSFLGTSSYELLWQEMCGKVFNDVRRRRLGTIGFELREPFDRSLDKVYESSVASLLAEHARMHRTASETTCNLANIMPRPQWRLRGSDQVILRRTLEPDLITITRDGSRGHWHLIVWDAKYYDVKVEDGKLTNNPGVEDIAKQQLYQIAYADFAQRHGMEMGNAFLCPAQMEDAGRLFAETVLPVYDDWLALNGRLELRPKVVKVYHVSGDVLMRNYLAGTTLPLAEILQETREERAADD